MEGMKRDISTSSTTSLWLAEGPRRDYPVLEEDLSCQVLVIGGGITGVSAAYELLEAGFDVVLLEKDRLASKASGNTTGKLTLQHSFAYQELLKTGKTDAARALLDSQQEALERFRQITATNDWACDRMDARAVLYGRTEAEARIVKREARAYDELGIPYDKIYTEFEKGIGLAVKDQIGFNAAKYVYAMAEYLDNNGVRLFEYSQAGGSLDKVTDGYRIKVNGDVTITCQYVIIASGYPAIDGGANFSFRLNPSRSLALAYQYDDTEESMYISAEAPYRSVRYSRGEKNYLIIVGGSHRVASKSSVRELQDEMKAWARKHFGVKEPAYAWAAQDYFTPDGLPYIGRLSDDEEHRNVFVATGFRKWGLGFGIWSGMYFRRLIVSETEEIETFKVTRDSLTAIALSQAKDKLGVLIDTLTEPGQVRELDDIGFNDGGIVEIAGKRQGVWVDGDGNRRFVSTSCTHMGCGLKWNDLEQSYDCPCHGSRFTREGFVIEGPAAADLKHPEEK